MHLLRRLPPLFFLGLFPVVCLLWAWADSQWKISTFSFCWTTGRGHSIGIYPSAISLTRTVARLEAPPAPLPPGWIPTMIPFSPLTPTFPGNFRRGDAALNFPDGAAFFARFQVRSREWNTPTHHITSSTCFLPIWLILLGYLPLWLGLSLWQARRRKRKIAKALPGPEPAPPVPAG